MKKLLMGLGLIALLAGCASENSGKGGSGDEYTTDTYHTNRYTVQFHNNAVNGTGSPLVRYGNLE